MQWTSSPIFLWTILRLNTMNLVILDSVMHRHVFLWFWIRSVLLNIGSGNGLLPEGTKQLTEPMYTYYQWISVALTYNQFHRSELTIIASDNGLSPGRRQVIIWNNAGILSIGLLGTNFSEILIEILIFQENVLESVVCEMATILSRSQCVKWKIHLCGYVHISEGPVG